MLPSPSARLRCLRSVSIGLSFRVISYPTAGACEGSGFGALAPDPRRGLLYGCYLLGAATTSEGAGGAFLGVGDGAAGCFVVGGVPADGVAGRVVAEGQDDGEEAIEAGDVPGDDGAVDHLGADGRLVAHRVASFRFG